MQTKLPGKFLRLFLLILLLLSLASLSLAQENYIQDALQIALDLIEEDIGRTLRITRWRYVQEDWSTQATWQKYGAFGIDNCAADIVTVNKRETFFGWTLTITDINGKSWQARVSFDLLESVLCDEVAAAPAAAVSAPPAAAGAARVGSFELGGQVTGLTSEAATAMRRAGMTWVKGQLVYNRANSGPVLARGKMWIDDAHNRDFKILLSVKGDHTELSQLVSDFDNYTKDFAGFLAQLAGQSADAIEVWNEPNIDREWPAGSVSGENYVTMLAKAHAAIKAANPNTMVISAAPSPTGAAGAAGCSHNGKTHLCNDDVFMQQMAAANAATYMDCLGLHYNEGALSPRATSGDRRGNPNYPTRYFSSMLNRGRQYFPNTPVCWTELGYLTGDGYREIPSGFAWASGTTLAQQAEWIADAAVLSAQSNSVRLMIVWNVNFKSWGADPQAGYALIRPDGACPGCDSLGRVMHGG